MNLGIDVSLYQEGFDFTRALAAGRVFAYIKCSEGLHADNTFKAHWQNAKAAGVLRGAYHYFRANVDPSKQAAVIISTVRDEQAGDWHCGELPIAIDVEFNQGVAQEEDLNIPPAEWAKRIRTLCKLVYEGTGTQPIIYTSKYMWETYVDPQGVEAWVSAYGLWVANWGARVPNLPRLWLNYVFHQTGFCNVDGWTVDANTYNGDNIFDYAQMLYIGRTKKISGEIESVREKYERLKDEQLEKAKVDR